MDSSVRVSRLQDIFLLQLASPDGFPRLTRSVLAQLGEQLEAASQSRDLRGVVISGTERAFAAGADLREVNALDALEALRFSALGQDLMRRIETFPKPVVAAIRGYCLGGGFDLAMACHLRVAATDAVFGHPGGTLGIISGWGGTARLPRTAGQGPALELLVTSRTLTAEEAYAWRLVNRVVAPKQLIVAALQFAGRKCSL